MTGYFKGAGRPTVLQCCLFLAAGSFVSIIVAWFFAWQGDPCPRVEDMPIAEADALLYSHFSRTLDFTLVHGRRTRGTTLTAWSVVAETPLPSSKVYAVGYCSTGWPMRMLYGKEIFVNGLDKYEWAIRIPKSFTGGRASYKGHGLGLMLPLRPLFGGLAVNSVVYAMSLYSVANAWFLCRHRLRRRKGLCPHCAYRVGSTTRCPECGRSDRGAGGGV